MKPTKPHKTYIQARDRFKKEIADLVALAMDQATISRLKALGSFHGNSITSLYNGFHSPWVARNIDLKEDRARVKAHRAANSWNATIEVPYEILDLKLSAQVAKLRADLLGDAADRKKCEVRMSYRRYLELKKRFEEPKGLDWTVAEEHKQTVANQKAAEKKKKSTKQVY